MNAAVKKFAVQSFPKVSMSYGSVLGEITLVACEQGVCGLYFEGQKHFPGDSAEWIGGNEAPFREVCGWLDRYFSRGDTGGQPTVFFQSGTEFQRKVWQALLSIPMGARVSYQEIARQIGAPGAARAVGAAVGRNPVSILVPCHRVVGSGGALTGYAGGLERKGWLLNHEAAEVCLALQNGQE